MRPQQRPRPNPPGEVRTLACATDRLYPDHWAGRDQQGCKGWAYDDLTRPPKPCECECHDAPGARAPRPAAPAGTHRLLKP